MFSRREFLSTSGLLAASATGLCRPAVAAAPVIRVGGDADRVAAEYIGQRKDLLRTHDPKVFLGYPGNMNMPAEGFFQWRQELRSVEVGRRVINNLGDPFRNRGVGASHMLEADLIERFAGRYGFEKGNVWGFVSNSGTDSNLHGAYIGGTLLHRRTGVMPRVYYTNEAHYSIEIVRDLLGLQEVLVHARDDGSMDTADLKAKLAANRDAPALVIATIGTTFRGAIDNIDDIQSQLKGYSAYVHLDAALFGGYLHGTDYVDSFLRQGPAGKRYDSMSISCHKFLGYPGVAGLFFMHEPDFEEFRNYFAEIHDPAYISHVPGTITCSRSPVPAAECHYYCTAPSLQQQIADANACLVNAAYLQGELSNHFPGLHPRHFDARSNIVYFDNRVAARVKKKWHLATVKATESQPVSLAHVVVMPHADRKLLDQFLTDLDTYRAGNAP